MSEQLDWLARNVHEWPTETDFVFVGTGISHGNMGWYPADYCFSESSLVTRQQWLDRRAELQNKPSWKDAPEWANWLCQRDDGAWFWLSYEPTVAGDEWGGKGGSKSCFPAGDLSPQNILGDWRDTLEQRPYISATDCTVTSSGSFGVTVGAPADLSEQTVTARLQEATDNVLAAVPELKSDRYKFEPALSRADALRWAVENVKTWPSVNGAVPPTSGKAPTGWEWVQISGSLYLVTKRCPAISEREWSRHVEQSYEEFTGLEDARPLNCRCVVRRPTTTLYTTHHAAFLHRGCQLLLSEPELVVFRTADGELIHCKPKECLIDPDVYGLAARLLADMSGHPVAPEHMRELAEQIGWHV